MQFHSLFLTAALLLSGAVASPCAATTGASQPLTSIIPIYNSLDKSAFGCPLADEKVYMFGGKKFKVQCGYDHPGTIFKQLYTDGLPNCVIACSADSTCVGAAWNTTSTLCSLNSDQGQWINSPGIDSAFPCPKGDCRHREQTAKSKDAFKTTTDKKKKMMGKKKDD